MRTFSHRQAPTPLNPAIEPSAPAAAVPARGTAPASPLAISRFAHDFSRVPVRARAPVGVQARLVVGAPDDAYEREADRVAEQVTHGRVESGIVAPGTFQPAREAPPRVSRKAQGAAGHVVPDGFHASLGSGQALDPRTRDYFEPRFGRDFSHVRVHTGAHAARLAGSINAQAYTVGRHVVFGDGRYAPETGAGRRLLAHELTHVVQQGGGQGVLQRAENDTVPGCAALKDSGPDVDKLVNAALAGARKNAGTPPAGKKVAEGVAGILGTDTSVGRTAIEDWASKLPANKQSLPAQSATKYAGVSYNIWSNPLFPILNPTMKISGFCVGSDKLGHFFQQGWTFRNTEAAAGTPAAEEQSERTEGGGFGLATTGVYSNADQEANRQGGKFYNDLIASPSMAFSISSYISSRWSEVDNPNFYEGSVGKQVWANLLTGKWTGTAWEGVPYTDDALVVNLSATTAGAVAGSFRVGTSIVAGTLKGTIRYDSRKVRGQSIFGNATTPLATTGIHIDLDWTLGSEKGKAILHSSGERQLTGSWGNGASTTDRGTWDVDRT